MEPISTLFQMYFFSTQTPLNIMLQYDPIHKLFEVLLHSCVRDTGRNYGSDVKMEEQGVHSNTQE
jgi:hypothetical protein